ncbi:MAG: TetR/AcrR family transcriptional regulator [Candidatus Competibacteraceae bacterium]
MNSEFQAFKRLVSLSRQETGRIVLHQSSESMAIQEEGLAVRTLLKLIDNTLKLSREKGFQDVRLRDLSETLGLSLSQLHHYVRDKKALLQLIQRYGHTLNARVLLDQIQEIHAPWQRLCVAVRTQLWLSEILPDWFLFWHLQLHTMTSAEKQQAIQAELSMEELFCNIIRTGQRQNVFQEVDPELTAAALKALLQDWYLQRWKYEERGVDVETYRAFLQTLLERQVQPTEALLDPTDADF